MTPPLVMASGRRFHGLMPHTFTHDHVGITLTPGDLDATIDWYSSKLDFILARRFDAHGITFAFITNGNVKIELMSAASRSQGASIENIFGSFDPERLHHICLAVEDLDTTLSQLAERDVASLGDPMEVPEIGQRIGFITDNTGNIIELTEPGT
jgi:catechol 2,3-dioxygenase-like lactoylglutathione lyase family enzyme